jgi:hypothetical protein
MVNVISVRIRQFLEQISMPESFSSRYYAKGAYGRAIQAATYIS